MKPFWSWDKHNCEWSWCQHIFFLKKKKLYIEIFIFYFFEERDKIYNLEDDIINKKMLKKEIHVARGDINTTTLITNAKFYFEEEVLYKILRIKMEP